MKETSIAERFLSCHIAMILDAIVVFFVSLFSSLAGAAAIVAIPVVNLAASLIELIGGIFVSGFKLGRLEKKEAEPRPLASRISSYIIVFVFLGAICWFFIAPRIMNREVTLLAEDGHTLPYAAVVIHTKNADQHERTDRSGKVKIPRFRTDALSMKDPRYVPKTWPRSEIEKTLTAERTVLGTGLDKLGDRLLKPAIPKRSGK